MQKDRTDVVEQGIRAARSLNKRGKVYSGAFINLSIENRVHDIGAISGGLSGVNLKFRPRESAWNPILR